MRRNVLIATLAALHGALLSAIVFCHLHADYEAAVYRDLVRDNVPSGISREEQALSMLNLAHHLVTPRLRYFRREATPTVFGTFFRSADVQLVDGIGACGSYTHVLARLLDQRDFDYRVVQMQCAKSATCHIMLEARVDGNWAALDALYNLHFRRPDGALASFAEVGVDWRYYRRQTPPHYDDRYRYLDAVYTNWDKIPVVMPAIKAALDALLGEERADRISVRAQVLDMWRTYEFLLIGAYVVLVALSIVLWFRFRRTG